MSTRQQPEQQRVPPCRICSAPTQPAGTVHGRYSARDYRLARCPSCGYGFVVDPWTDFAQIYDQRYYAGEGADPMVDYRFELDHPEETVRRYEWAGIARVVRDLTADAGSPSASSPRWLDYGCGNGGLVRYLRAGGLADAVGFDEGAIAAEARARGIPVLAPDALSSRRGSFDVITAVEVLEHTLDPVSELRAMRRLLHPGGLLFLTTGNARPYTARLDRWRYVIPEIHISFFEPRTLERALSEAGFTAERRNLRPGFDQILKFKVLKNLKLRQRSRLTDAIPARLLALADLGPRLSEHPVGWAA